MLRLPPAARQALARQEPVEVTHHGSLAFCLLCPEDYDAVSAILERRRGGRPVPVDTLLDDDDMDLLAQEAAADAGLDQGILESWTQPG